MRTPGHKNFQVYNTTLIKTFGAKLKDVLNKYNLTQADCAKQVGLTEDQIHKIIKRGDMKPEWVPKIQRWLNTLKETQHENCTG